MSASWPDLANLQQKKRGNNLITKKEKKRQKMKIKANNPDMSAFLADLASWQSLPKNSQSLKLFAIDQIVCHTNKQASK